MRADDDDHGAPWRSPVAHRIWPWWSGRASAGYTAGYSEREHIVIRTIREGDLWQLQTGATYLRHTETGRRITLIAMIHIGRPDYYARLGQVVDEHEGLVLFEGLGELATEDAAALSDEERRVYDSLAALNAAYRRVAAALHLVAQPDAMPRPGPDWVRADLPVRELLQRWVKARLPLIPVMDAAGQALDSAMMRRTTRLLLLQEPFILSAFQLLRGWAPGLGRLTTLLIDERNAAALKVFDGVDAGQDVIMTYGAGHIPGLLAGFTARGYRETARDWFTAHSERIPGSAWLDRLSPLFRMEFGRR